MAALSVVTLGGTMAALGTTPALASSPPPHARPAPGFSHPASISGAHTACQPAVNHCPVTSQIWAGYVDAAFSTSFTSVSADWVQTRVTCPKPDAWSLFWIGLDGRTSQTVEQGGSEAQCLGGTPHYYAWWEMYPTDAIQPAFPVSVGDHIDASVVYSAANDTYTVTVNDTTAGHTHALVVVAATQAADTDPNTYTITQDGVTTGPTSFAPGTLCLPSTPCQNSSAEWIVEAPGGDGSPQTLYPLARFGPIVFRGANAIDTDDNDGTITDPAWQYTALDLVNTAARQLVGVDGLKNGGRRFRAYYG